MDLTSQGDRGPGEGGGEVRGHCDDDETGVVWDDVGGLVGYEDGVSACSR